MLLVGAMPAPILARGGATDREPLNAGESQGGEYSLGTMNHPGCKMKATSHWEQALDALKDAPEELRKAVSAAFRFLTDTIESHPNLSCPYCADPLAVAAVAITAGVAAATDRSGPK